MTKTTAAKWRAIIREQERSGRTVREFAATRGFSPGTLFWWRSKLRKRPLGDGTLVPVEVLESAADCHRGPIELQVRDDLVLRLPHDFDEADLRRVLTVLGRPC